MLKIYFLHYKNITTHAMDPVIDNEWLKNEPFDEPPVLGNIARSWQWRERGINPPNYPPNKTVLENVAEDILVQNPLKIRCCDLPGYPRSTFLMVFSPDGTKVASTHGNHNVYVSELASGKHVRILKGHPRTPWCIAFHPSHPQLIGSGCLGGQVRVWDITSGGSEVWNVRCETVIASIAFHPREQMLAIATYNELYFWDWSQPAPFTKVSTNNVNEKVRYVAFDALGYKLITGISLWACPGGANNSLLQQIPLIAPNSNLNNINRRDDPDESSTNRPQENPGTAQDMIVNSYQNLVQRYDSLVRNYQRLFMVRHRLTNTPPPPNTIDRGTDPMETDLLSTTSSRTRSTRSTSSNIENDNNNPTPSTSRRQDGESSADGEGTSSRLLNLDVLSIDSPSRRQRAPNLERILFGSRSSAFHPLNESGRSFRTVDQNEQTTRLLPNPFSSSNGTPRPTRVSFSESTQQSSNNPAYTSRTSIFTPTRSGTPTRRDFLVRRRNIPPPQHNSDDIPSTSTDNVTNSPPGHVPLRSRSPPDATPSTSGLSARRPAMTNSSTQMSPVASPLDAQTLNESLDLIRDILRDSGNRLLNLITNMSLSMLSGSERGATRRANRPRAHSEDSEGGGRARAVRSPGARRGSRPRVRLFSSGWRRDLLSSSSDSDSDRSHEVNVFRTIRNTLRENERRDVDRPVPEATTSMTGTGESPSDVTDRMVFELNENAGPSREPRSINENAGPSREPRGINVSLSNRFRVRTQGDADADIPPGDEGDTGVEDQASETLPSTDLDLGLPSTSRENFWTRDTEIPSDEAFRKVKSGVTALQKHTTQLANLWIRGTRTTMRELRNMWENLRRRIMMLHRQTGRQDPSSYYTRSLLERCMILTEMSENVSRTTARNVRSNIRNEEHRYTDRRRGETTSGGNANSRNSDITETDVNTLENVSEERRLHSARSSQQRLASGNNRPTVRRRVQSSYRWRPEDEQRRRTRNITTNRMAPRHTRSRRDFARAIEINTTRHEIRTRAMQVLSVMFNMMMMCLEERGLSQLIITMLRTLKKALALTCFMLMTNRNNSRTGTSSNPSSQRVDSLDVVRIQNVDHTGPVNVDGPDDPVSPSITHSSEQPPKEYVKKSVVFDNERPSTSQSSTVEANAPGDSSSPNYASQRWSNRLAVQIAAANRNNSATARSRRELYLESKRMKALHRTNPIAHPLIRKRVLPPVSTYRIPALRNLSSVTRLTPPKMRILNVEPPPAPVCPNNARENSNQESPHNDMSEFDHRVNFIRIAQTQAIRLRNAARNRFRRLQTIRLYTPSSVREMFALQSSSPENLPENRLPLPIPAEIWNSRPLPFNVDVFNRRSFAMYRPHILTPRSEWNNQSEESNNTSNNSNASTSPGTANPANPANNSDAQASPSQRLPRIHEYLQPIILAQNAMVVEEEIIPGGAEGGGSGGAGGGGGGAGGGVRRLGGMAGLLDTGIISETLPAPSHRVQAWDFTTWATPDIADNTKNVVVQRCRIHNDASIDISKDGRLLVALLPVPRLRNTNHWLGVYSLEWSRLGQCLHTAVLEQSAVSVALSPTARHLAVGLGARRFATAPPAAAAHPRTSVFALLYRLDPRESLSRTGLSPIRELEQNWEQGFTSLNCLRWAPQPGQGLVYANNTGQLIIMS
ncbi:hypothetical protein K1T71_002666 [Dendrolimus kikuchii]|uniref:Uncharacterized protein n=1 Tax=Dendrolimus kikuchii TaxID=765133 RepID=A0ACC1DDW9_9NEOP|nr:hypothetical protein K1T71_002666 [Dendrolimus kikuchii]